VQCDRRAGGFIGPGEGRDGVISQTLRAPPVHCAVREAYLKSQLRVLDPLSFWVQLLFYLRQRDDDAAAAAAAARPAGPSDVFVIQFHATAEADDPDRDTDNAAPPPPPSRTRPRIVPHTLSSRRNSQLLLRRVRTDIILKINIKTLYNVYRRKSDVMTVIYYIIDGRAQILTRTS